MPLRATATVVEPDLLFLPWGIPLEQWPAGDTVALARGISRHTVRFVRADRAVYAVKETEEPIAKREYELLVSLRRLGAPCVEPVGVIAGREGADGQDLPAALLTRHLSFSLPYRALVQPTLSPEIWDRLLDALVLLVVRLHLLGFAWNDCSLSNTLFRRDAGAFSAYLVDAETGELHESLSRGQRAYDLETATMNVAGELMDLQDGGMLPDVLEPSDVGADLRRRYEHLWLTLTDAITVSRTDRYQIHTLLRTLNGLGFDVAEITADSTDGGSSIRVRPKVVSAGHHSRRMRHLTGLEMHENQARRLLNDIDSHRYVSGLEANEQAAAHAWVVDVYERILLRIPPDLRGRREAPELVHEVLAHRWFSSERSGRDVGLDWATDDYVARYLRDSPDEAALLGPPPLPDDTDDDVDADDDDGPEPGLGILGR